MGWCRHPATDALKPSRFVRNTQVNASVIASTIEAAVEDAKARYAELNPNSRAVWQQAMNAMPGGNTRSVLYFSPFPLCMSRGEGSFLFDADDHRYVDFLGEYTAGIYGHSNEIIRAAIIETLENGISLASHSRVESDLAHLIRERFESIELIRFTNSGSEANLMAITTAIAATRRKGILVFSGSYHGGLLSFGSAHSAATNVPYDYVVAPYDETAEVRRIIRENRDHLAAILVEPMLGAGGCVPAKPEFLQMLAEEARASGAILIFDEIQTSRLSSGGRQKLLGIRPDLTTLGKYFGGGLSFGAFGGRVDLMAQFDPRRPSFISHAGTFNNNVLSMAAGFAGLSRVLHPQVLSDLNARGESLMANLNELLAKEGTALYLTGLGSIMNFHWRGETARAAAVLQILFFDLLLRGYYIAPRGMMALSLAISGEQISDFIEAVRGVVRARRSLFAR